METDTKKPRFKWNAWVSLAVLILMISGVFRDAESPLAALDFTNLAGGFGVIADGLNFLGTGGTGAREGFLQALNIAPVVILFSGILNVCRKFGAMEASSTLFQPFLQPLMGIPSSVGMALVGSLTSTDVGAAMTRDLREAGRLTEDELTVFAAFQLSGSAMITNLMTTGLPLLAIVPYSSGFIFLLCMLCKVLGANCVRVLLALSITSARKDRKDEGGERNGKHKRDDGANYA